jgi:hypothetical protein
MRGKVLISYHYSPALARKFRKYGFKVYRMKTTRGAGVKGKVPCYKLVAANYDLRCYAK